MSGSTVVQDAIYPFALVLTMGINVDTAQAGEVRVLASSAACKDPAIVEKFEAFERKDDDQ
jgi:hypothetical protein